VGAAMPDYLTVLHSVHKKHAAKQFTFLPGKKGNPDKTQNKSYGQESHFRVEQIPVDNFGDLNTALERLAVDPFAFIIRDEPLSHTNLNHARRWARPHGNEPATFAPAPRQWLPIDLDHITAPALTDVIFDPEAAIEYLIGLLPKELHDVKCRWQLTSSQGLPGSEGLLSARFYYWLNEKHDNDALKRWAAAANAAVGCKLIDPVLYHPIQAIYTAAPLFQNMTDPLPRRCGVRDGLDDEACLIIPPADKKHPDQISGEGYEPGHGVAAYLAQIGKPHFREPLRSAIASYIAIYGAAADTEPVKRAIRKAFSAVDPDWAQNDTLCRYGSDDHLDDIIAAIRAFQGDKPGQGWTQPPPEYLDEPPPVAPNADMLSASEPVPTTYAELITAFNKRYVVANEAGKAMIFEPIMDPVRQRQVLIRIRFEDFRKFYMNRTLTMVTTDPKTSEAKEITKTFAEWWLSSPQRRQYIGGVVFDPTGKSTPEFWNLWTGL
jgi:hypothetical protein